MIKFDLIVVGAGHAGLEASFVASKFGLKVGLFNMTEHSIANLPCNPSIGGPAKGVLTREIDALGGIQGIAADATKLQIKNLNSSKGPGVWAYRAQIDKNKFHSWFLQRITNDVNITLICKEITKLVIESGIIRGVNVVSGEFYSAKVVVITCGVYLGAELHRDVKFATSGPDNNPSSHYLAEFFKEWGVETVRLKTGTSPRIYKNSIDFSKLRVDPDNDVTLAFSFVEPQVKLDQMDCFLSETTAATFSVIRENLSSLGGYNGSISGEVIGPRYCPSIEDKIIKFPHRTSHHIFVEPVSEDCDYYYLAGMSTSMSSERQLDLVRSLIGFENAQIHTYAYSIVYDSIDPKQLRGSMELKSISGLFFAGQVCGSSGYEEAAGQGLYAGINAALKILNQMELILKKEDSYLGLLISDLINMKRPSEPYRLLTSRMYRRMSVRSDNADQRLMGVGYRLGLIDPRVFSRYSKKWELVEKCIEVLKNTYVDKFLLPRTGRGPCTLSRWLFTTSDWKSLLKSDARSLFPTLDESVWIQVGIEIKCRPYEKLNKGVFFKSEWR